MVQVDLAELAVAKEQVGDAAVPQRLELDEVLGRAAVGVDVGLGAREEHRVLLRRRAGGL